MPLTFNDIKSEIASAVNSDYRAVVLLERLRTKGGGYKEAHAYALRVGRLIGRVLQRYQPEDLSEWDLDDLIPGTLGLDHSMVTVACIEAQKNINLQAEIGIRPQEPKFDGNRAFGLVEAVKKQGKISSLFYDQITNFSQNVVDQAIKDNAAVHSNAGLRPKIVRTAEAHCCEYCDKLDGTYDYVDVKTTGDPVWTRHDNCRCLIEYIAESRRERVNNYRRR